MFPIKVTKRRFPQMLHVGDITKLDGGKLPPVDVICGGSPCQDLSVAGARAGLAGERSGLFMEQIRIVKEMRAADEKRGRTAELIIDYFSQGDNAGYRIETHRILHTEESNDTMILYGLVCYQGYDSTGTQVQECPHPMEAVVEQQDNQYVVKSFNDWFDLQSELPFDLTVEAMEQIQEELRTQCKNIAARHFGFPETPPAPVVENPPFTNQPISWDTPLNGMFERTYETQLSMLGNIDQTSPPFFKSQTFEFETCTVLLGTSLDLETTTQVATIYILFRSGSLGKLPVPLDTNGIAVLPSAVIDAGNNTITYDVSTGSSIYHYTVDLTAQTVSMTVS